MSAKDDLAFVEFHREEACTNGMSSCSYSAFVRLLALAERGARFTKEHEARIAELEAEHERLIAGLESVIRSMPPDEHGHLLPGRVQAELVLGGSKRPLERLRNQVSELEAQRDEARRFAEEAAKRYNDLLASGPTLTCAFCGQEYPKGTPPTQHEALTAHVRVCEKHPLAQKIVELEAQLAYATEQRDALAENDFPLWSRLLALAQGDQSFGRARVVDALEAQVSEQREALKVALLALVTIRRTDCLKADCECCPEHDSIAGRALANPLIGGAK